MKRSANNTLISDENPLLRKGVAVAYIELGKVLTTLGHQSKAQTCYKKAEDFG